MNEYDKQARRFLAQTESGMYVDYIKYDYYFDGDKYKRDIYEIKLKRILRHRNREYKFTFGQSLAKRGEKPTEYQILACLGGNDVGSFEDFCDIFGYDQDSIKAFKIYKKVADEFKNLSLLYSDSELEMLSEIQ